jgi:hypothetical protein
MVIAALKTSAVAHTPSGSAFIEKIVRDPLSKASCVIIDLATIPDGEHLISFIQSSPSIRHIPIVALGTPEHFDALSEGVEHSLNGVITAPYTAGEIAVVIASVCDK